MISLIICSRNQDVSQRLRENIADTIGFGAWAIGVAGALCRRAKTIIAIGLAIDRAAIIISCARSGGCAVTVVAIRHTRSRTVGIGGASFGCGASAVGAIRNIAEAIVIAATSNHSHSYH